MKRVVSDPGRPIGAAPAAPRPVEHQAAPARDAELEAIWPRRFDLAAVRAMLGDGADQVVADVLASRVNAPLWSLVDRGGSRWRPTISRLAFLASGGTPAAPEAICQVSELLHTGSLIIDDIQDGASERRGGPAAHEAFGIPTALGAANTAYFRALEVLRGALPDALRLRALDMLAQELLAAHLGQALDLTLGAELAQRRLRAAHYVVLASAKTGALVRIAARLGAIAAGADVAREAALGAWAGDLGVAYQIRNDLDDLACGMHDVVTCRPTYPILLVLEGEGPAAAAVRAQLGRGLDAAAVRALRLLFAREGVPERASAAACAAAARARAALGLLPSSDARTALERITCELAGDETSA